MAEPRKPTCKRVLARLRAAGGGWVRGIDLAHPDVGGLRFGGRVHELRSMGFDIEDRPDPSGKTRVHQYRLVEQYDHIPGPTLALVERDPNADHDHVYVQQEMAL